MILTEATVSRIFTPLYGRTALAFATSAASPIYFVAATGPANFPAAVIPNPAAVMVVNNGGSDVYFRLGYDQTITAAGGHCLPAGQAMLFDEAENLNPTWFAAMSNGGGKISVYVGTTAKQIHFVSSFTDSLDPADPINASGGNQAGFAVTNADGSISFQKTGFPA